MELETAGLEKLREKLAPHVEEQFGVSLYKYMKQKVEVESLYNYEIANILNLDKKKVGLLIKDFGLRKINGFSNRFEHRYGTGSIRIFKNMVEDPEKSLSDVGRHFGFSREYARQVYEKIYRHSYAETFKSKIREKRCRKEESAKKTKVAYLREVRAKMRSLGIASKIINERNLYRIIAWDATVDVRISAKPSTSGNKQYFHIAYPKGTTLNSDFFICVCEDQEKRTYYIIPREEMPDTGLCLIPQAKHHESKYAIFKEAWHQLNMNSK